MKGQLIYFISLALLLSNCSRNAFVIKKRYSKGFYCAKAAKTKTEHIVFYPEQKITENEEQIIVTKPTETNSTINGFAETRLNDVPINSIKPLNKIVQARTNSERTSSQNISAYRNGSKANDTVAASVGILVALVTILALVKTFGLIFTLPVCFVISFTAIAIFFMIRTHVKD